MVECYCYDSLRAAIDAVRKKGQMNRKSHLIAPLEGPGVIAHIKGVRALPHAAAGAKLVADAVARLRHDGGRALPVRGLPKHHLRSRDPVSQHSVGS